MKKKTKIRILNIILAVIIGYCAIETVPNLYNYFINKYTYYKIRKEKEENKQKLLSENGWDWIYIEGTNIDYPIVQAKDNKYYLHRDVYGEFNLGGSIYYSSYNKNPLEDKATIIYGHSMKDGTMFNNLHLFEDEKEFKESELIITTKEGEDKVYKPLGVQMVDSNFIHNNLNSKTIDEAVKMVQDVSIHDIKVEYSENSTIIALVTCDYNLSANGKLITFYIN